MGGLSLNLGTLAREWAVSHYTWLTTEWDFLTVRAVRTCELQIGRMEFVSHLLYKFVITVAQNTREVGKRTVFIWTLVASLGAFKGYMKCFGLCAVAI